MIRSLRDWFIALPVRGKLTTTATVQLLVLTLGCAAFLLTLRELAATRTLTLRAYAVIHQIEALHGEVLKQQSAVRGYLVSAHPESLDAYAESSTSFDTRLRSLRTLTVNNPAQTDRLERLMGDWRRQVAEPSFAAVKDPATRPLAVDRVDRGEDKQIVDAIEQLCWALIAEERSLLGKREHRVEQLQRVLIGLTLGLLFIGWFSGIRAVGTLNRLLGRPLATLAALLPRLNSGEAVDVPYRERRDEVGALAQAFHQLRDTRVEQTRHEWVGERSAQLIGALQLCDSEELFAEILLRRLSESLDAGYALAYRWNDQSSQLEWCAAFGLPDPAVARRRFRLGEGLVGQCMVERRLIEITPVPDGHLRVISGLGAALPQVLLFVPVTARGETVAVLELGLLYAVQPRHRELIEEVLTTTGLSWQALARSLRTRELLADSQAQAEELRASEEALQAQREELSATNEALRARTGQLEEQGRRLQASEEELRAQAEELGVTNSVLEEKSQALSLRQTELETARGELERRATDLEQASRYKSEFLANMSHELRTPLNSMLILSKMLADNADGNLDAEQVESARIVHDSGQSLLGLINDILDLSKVEAGKMKLDLDDIDLAECLSRLVDRFRPLAAERGVVFEMTVAADAPSMLHNDRTRLSQVISNLLSNAFKFTHQGRVELHVARIPEGAAISVRDSGIGISPEQLERVFQAFEQADTGTSRRYGGTGLGLSIVSRLTALMGGEVLVESREGEGSTFTIRLPERPGQRLVSARRGPARPAPLAASTNSTAAPVEAPTASTTPVLLVVDDDPTFARLLADIAARRGLEAVIAGSGHQALELARRHRLIGVLLDIGLPDISGWEVLERLKADPSTATVPVHVISGVPEAERCLALGAVGFLQKPVTRDAVVHALEQVRGGAASGERRRLLLVDDDAVSRAAVRVLLKHENAEIVEAVDAEKALAMLQAQRFDGVILDLGLPGISGFDFLDQASGKIEMPPVVIYSGRDLTQDEMLRLRGYTESIVVKGARSPERLLDEVALFLHAVHRPGAAAVPGPATPHSPATDVAGKTLLVVDDDMRNVFALSRALRGRGLNVVMAQDGYKALAQLESRKDIDLVLMDVMMPGMDGFETIRRIRARQEWHALPIIAVTAKAMKGDREKCLEAGANDYCPKPVDIEQLMSQVRVWI